MMKNRGFCICCDRETEFSSKDSWLRDHYLCAHCGSIPRERTLMKTIELFYPGWREFSIHESSPVDRGATRKLSRNCARYVASQYWPARPLGVKYEGVYNINLEQQSFENSSFDLVITQDVFEHLYHPQKSVWKVCRTLKDGGAHVCTVPLVNKDRPTQKWSELRDGEIRWLHYPEYHGNPVDSKGAPVSYHFGFDFCNLAQD